MPSLPEHGVSPSALTLGFVESSFCVLSMVSPSTVSHDASKSKTDVSIDLVSLVGRLSSVVRLESYNYPGRPPGCEKFDTGPDILSDLR
jgi:hypothetical protein